MITTIYSWRGGTSGSKNYSSHLRFSDVIIEFLPAIADGIARVVTRKAQIKAAVLIEELPFSTYENGEKIASIQASYEQHYKAYRTK